MVNLPVARLLASRLLAAAAQGHAPSASATALRAYAGPPMRKYKGAWNGKESRAEKAHKQDALFKQKLLRELTPASTSASSSTAESSAQSSASSSSAESSPLKDILSNVMPTWMSSWLPSATQPKRSSAASSNMTSSSSKQEQIQRVQPKKEEKKDEKKDDPWKDIEKHRNCSIDVFVTRCQNNAADLETAAKQPRKRSARGPNADRIMFLRNNAHWEACKHMTQADKRLIESDPDAALQDKLLLRRIAGPAKLSINEAQDCLRNYKLLRERINDLIELKESGRPMPEGREDVEAALEKLQEEKEKKDLQVILKRRDLENCPVRPWVAVLGSDTKCPNTKLQYRQCCGDKRTRVVPAM